jgi:peroxiredoxin
MKKYARIFSLIAIVTVLASITACQSGDSAAATTSVGKVTNYRVNMTQPLAKDQPAPDFQFEMPGGDTVLLSDFKGKVVLLNFWRVDCPYCVDEMPLLEKAQLEWQGKNIVVLGINIGDSQNKVRSFLTDKGLTFPIILDQDAYPASLYSVSYVPMTYIIDQAGIIGSAQIGAFNTYEELKSEIIISLARITS